MTENRLVTETGMEDLMHELYRANAFLKGVGNKWSVKTDELLPDDTLASTTINYLGTSWLIKFFSHKSVEQDAISTKRVTTRYVMLQPPQEGPIPNTQIATTIGFSPGGLDIEALQVAAVLTGYSATELIELIDLAFEGPFED